MGTPDPPLPPLSAAAPAGALVNRTQWITLAALGAPVLAGAVIVSATFGPAGAIAYGGILLAGVNAPRLFHHDHEHEDHR